MITDYFSNLTDVLKADFAAAQQSPRHGTYPRLLEERFLQSWLPRFARLNSGMILDLKERQVGPFDIVASLDSWPLVGQGEAAFSLADGVMFCLSARDWTVSDLTQFAAQATAVKALEKKSASPILCAAFSFGPLQIEEVQDFLKSQAGQGVDAICTLGHHVVLRNNLGWYGDPAKIPFVTERSAAAALKFFAFYLLQAAYAAAKMPFAPAFYQHL